VKNGRPPKIPGIPTLYRGTRFRSRTEARWAVLFDELGWGWVYEPRDLAGYIPDFILRLDEAPLLVEVKGDAVTVEQLVEHAHKIEISGWDGEALLVGAAPWHLTSSQPLIGWFGERVRIGEDLEWSWGDARLFDCISCGHTSVLAASGSWRCRICGEGAGNEHVGAVLSIPLEAAWAKSSNRVQWSPNT